jgi:hypothetical protein
MRATWQLYLFCVYLSICLSVCQSLCLKHTQFSPCFFTHSEEEEEEEEEKLKYQN